MGKNLYYLSICNVCIIVRICYISGILISHSIQIWYLSCNSRFPYTRWTS